MQHRFFVVKKKTSSSKFPAVSMARLARENHFTLVEFIYFNIEYCQLRMSNYRWYFLLLLTCSADFVSSWTFRWTHHCHHWNYCRNQLQVVRAKEDENSLSLSFTHLNVWVIWCLSSKNFSRSVYFISSHIQNTHPWREKSKLQMGIAR